MWLKAEQDKIIFFPYSASALMRDNPNVSFPHPVPVETLEAWGVFEVLRQGPPAYDPTTHSCEPALPTYTDGTWVETWKTLPLSSQEIEQKKTEQREMLEQSVRQERDYLLSKTDWIVLKSYESAKPVLEDWVLYRQALRDVPTQSSFPHSIVWPVAPET